MHSLSHQVAAIHSIQAGALQIAYQELGPAAGPPVLLLHGFPYDVHAYAAVAPRLAEAGCRVIVPWLRGFGETRFLHADTPRSGQQSALAFDVLHLMDALHLPQAVDANRLLQKEFFEDAARAVISGGCIKLTTDDREYFEWAQKEAEKCSAWVPDLSWTGVDEPTSEFEELFAKEGREVYRKAWRKR